VYQMVTQSEAKGNVVCVALSRAVSVAPRQGRPDSDSQPTESARGPGDCVRAKRRVYIPLCLLLFFLRCVGGVLFGGGPKISRDSEVRCKLSSGRGCLMYVERGPGQAVCQAQILSAKVLGRVV
jgi:hypothetical protein